MQKFSEYINEKKMTEQEFLNRLVDMVDGSDEFDYMKMTTKEILDKIIIEIRKNKKYKALYTYWNANRTEDLVSKINKLFD